MNKVYRIFDAAAGAHIQQFFLPNDAVAMRAAKDAADDGAVWGRHPEQFSLVCCGTDDPVSGLIDQPSAPIFVCSIDSLVVQQDVVEDQVPMELVENG